MNELLDRKAEIFWRHVTPNGDKCWEWKSATVSRGYGYMTAMSKQYYAHRVSYEIHHGPIDEGMFICHHCDNMICVNPEHLFMGTAKDNTRDMIAKGRSWLSSITSDEVEVMRSMFLDGHSVRELAKNFGFKHMVSVRDHLLLNNVNQRHSIIDVDAYLENVRRLLEIDRIENREGVKLSRDKVQNIKKLLAKQEMQQKDIALLFGVDESTITRIKQGAIWGWVK